MKKYTFLAISFFLLLFATSCDKEDENVMDYTHSWLPITDFDGKVLLAQYTSGNVVKIKLKVKSFDDNKVTKVTVFAAELDETTGTAKTQEQVAEYQASSFVYNETYQQYDVKIEYTAPAKYENKKIVISAEIIAENGNKQVRNLATLGIAEPIPYLIQGITYFYMFDNTVDADQSAGSSCLSSVMHLYKPFLSHNDEVGGENGSGYNPDFVMGFYSSSRWNTSVGVSYMFNSDAGWYGINKQLVNIENGTFTMIEAELTAGRPVIVFGNFRKDKTFKHAILLVGMGSTKVVAIDPAGKWDGTVNGNYTQNKTAGVYVSYTKSQIKAAIGSDGAIQMNTVTTSVSK